MSKRKLREFIIDPSSGEYSASRMLLCVLILAYLPAMVTLDVMGLKLAIWTHFALIVSSVAGIYGVNTAGRVWRSQGSQQWSEEQYTPPGPPPPKAKPAP